MYKLAFLFSMLLTFNANANSKKSSDLCSECKTENFEECTLRKTLFSSNENLQASNLDISTIELVEIEEDVELNFDTKQYLPKGFNALKGKDDLDWNTIELVEIEEDVELNFDTKQYLPKGFNALYSEDVLGQSIANMVLLEIEQELGYKLTKKIYCSL
jgi:hypothetical protein